MKFTVSPRAGKKDEKIECTIVDLLVAAQKNLINQQDNVIVLSGKQCDLNTLAKVIEEKVDEKPKK